MYRRGCEDEDYVELHEDSIQQWFFISTTQNHCQVLKLEALLEQMMNNAAHCLETSLMSERCLIFESVYQLIVTNFFFFNILLTVRLDIATGR